MEVRLSEAFVASTASKLHTGRDAFLTDSFKVLSITLVIVSSMAFAVAAICFQEVVITKMMRAAAAAYFRYSLGFITAATRIQQAQIAQ